MTETAQIPARPARNSRQQRALLVGKWWQCRYFWVLLISLLTAGLLILAGLWFVWHRFEADRRNIDLRAELRSDVFERVVSLGNFFSSAAQQLAVASQIPKIRAARSDPDGAAAVLRVLLHEVPNMTQARILDLQGHEMVRLDRRQNRIVRFTGDDLQDKSDRYYYQISRNLLVSSIYVSPIDLNVEFDKIELPWRPTIRFVTPVVDDRSERIGFLVFNIDVSEPLRAFGQNDSIAGRTVLLNSDGYWLAGESDDLLWGFMTGSDASMARRDPHLWAEISESTQNRGFEAAERFYEVTPMRLSDVIGQGHPLVSGADDLQLFVVGDAISYDRGFSPEWRDWFILGTGFVLAVLLSGAISYLWVKRQQAGLISDQAEHHLIAAQRMASLGRIVAGVSHEMRTPIGNAYSVITALGERMDELRTRHSRQPIDDSELADILDELAAGLGISQRNIERATTLIGHFRKTAAHQSDGQRREFDLVEVIGDLAGSVRSQLEKRQIRLIFNAGELVVMDSFSGAVDQVLLSLIQNARQHAFGGDRRGGVISISIRNDTEDDAMVTIDVADDGNGISPENLDRIFEPFWTSDRAAGGTGLGLSIAVNVVENVLGGHIGVSSVVGEGTVFSLHLPRTAPGETIIDNRQNYDTENLHRSRTATA